MFEFRIAADVGSSLTRIATGRTVFVDETRLALDPSDGRAVLAVGRASARILNASPVYPVRGGVADITLTALLLRRMTLNLLKRRSLIGVSLSLAVPMGAGDIIKSAAMQAGLEAGFSRVRLVSSMIAGAEGAGVDIFADRARMLIDIGREQTSIMTAANGGVITESRIGVGSSRLDGLFQAYIAEEYGMLISRRAAEKLKLGLDKPQVFVHGKDSESGSPLIRCVGSRELREAAAPAVRLLEYEIISAIDSTPPDAAADLSDTGITLIGGGAERFGLAQTLEKDLGIPVRTANNARSAVILGMQRLAFRKGGSKSDTA